jgi:hypothetical protein
MSATWVCVEVVAVERVYQTKAWVNGVSLGTAQKR